MNSPKPIRVLLADDHSVVRQGLCALLSIEPEFLVIGQAANGREAVQLAHRLRPDVIVIDIAMPGLNGVEATRQILAANPAARVIVLSAHSDDEYVERMREAGAAGFLEKQSSAESLTRAIREVAQGRAYYSPTIARRTTQAAHPTRDRHGMVKTRANRLTTREAEVLQLVAEGSANKQIADTLGISVKTVEKHRQHLMDKLHIHDTASLTRYAIANGVIEAGVKLTII
ncbi:MAG: DNA-binding response regulator [Opitutus sp.]|nr:DNA-binding response regulator [Opitutus sp.]